MKRSERQILQFLSRCNVLLLRCEKISGEHSKNIAVASVVALKQYERKELKKLRS